MYLSNKVMCPFCFKLYKATGWLDKHIKSEHPEKTIEYMTMEDVNSDRDFIMFVDSRRTILTSRNTFIERLLTDEWALTLMTDETRKSRLTDSLGDAFKKSYEMECDNSA